jgi:1,4-dihydroxy-2-naphthoyl-CoA synthase
VYESDELGVRIATRSREEHQQTVHCLIEQDRQDLVLARKVTIDSGAGDSGRRAKEILMLGERYTATEAAAMGWINRAVPDDELDAVVADWCTKLLAHSPQALRLTKMSIDVPGDLALPSVRHGFETLTQMYGTAEFHEGTSAFLERRPPRFRRGTIPD